MKVIDLLNKIANKEELPQKIKIYGRNDSIYQLRNIQGTNIYYYTNIETNERLGAEWHLDGAVLNSEVEIINDKKIEKLEAEEEMTENSFSNQKNYYLLL